MISPIAITAWVLWRTFTWIDNLIQPLQERYPIIDWPGVGFVAVLLLLLTVGGFASNIVGSQIISRAERLLYKLPLVRRIYTAVKELAEIFLSEKKSVFQEVVIVPYPHASTYALAFLTEESGAVNSLLSDDVVSVFVPTTPNPTSGFLLFVPRSLVRRVPITVEEGLKMVVSGGAFVPQSLVNATEATPV